MAVLARKLQAIHRRFRCCCLVPACPPHSLGLPHYLLQFDRHLSPLLLVGCSQRLLLIYVAGKLNLPSKYSHKLSIWQGSWHINAIYIPYKWYRFKYARYMKYDNIIFRYICEIFMLYMRYICDIYVINMWYICDISDINERLRNIFDILYAWGMYAIYLWYLQYISYIRYIFVWNMCEIYAINVIYKW